MRQIFHFAANTRKFDSSCMLYPQSFAKMTSQADFIVIFQAYRDYNKVKRTIFLIFKIINLFKVIEAQLSSLKTGLNPNA